MSDDDTPTINGPKELREAFAREKENHAATRQQLADAQAQVRGFMLDKAGVPEQARDAAHKLLDDDAWQSPDAIREGLAAQGITFAPAEDAPASRMTPEDHERMAAQGRLDDLYSTGKAPYGGPPSLRDEVAIAEAAGDFERSGKLKAQQLLKSAGIG